MSMPTIPHIKPEIEVTFEDAVNLLLKSIAMEEIGISELLHAEKDKIMFILDECKHIKADADDVLKVNESVNKVIVNLSKLQMLLHFKLDSIRHLTKEPPCKPVYCLNGVNRGLVSNREDRFYRSTATLNAAVSLSQPSKNAISYHVGEAGRKLDMTATAAQMKIECPCRRHPGTIRVYGQGRLTEVFGGHTHKRTVSFVLHVCDGEARCDRFRMLIKTCKNRAVLHRSGSISVEHAPQHEVIQEHKTHMGLNVELLACSDNEISAGTNPSPMHMDPVP